MVASVLLPLAFTYPQWQVQCDPCRVLIGGMSLGLLIKFPVITWGSLHRVVTYRRTMRVDGNFAINSSDFDREVGDTCLMGAKGEMKIGLVGILNFRFHPSSIGILRGGGPGRENCFILPLSGDKKERKRVLFLVFCQEERVGKLCFVSRA